MLAIRIRSIQKGLVAPKRAANHENEDLKCWRHISRPRHIVRLAAIADAGPSIFTGAIDVDAMKIALGEIANVWPDSIQESESALT